MGSSVNDAFYEFGVARKYKGPRPLRKSDITHVPYDPDTESTLNDSRATFEYDDVDDDDGDGDDDDQNFSDDEEYQSLNRCNTLDSGMIDRFPMPPSTVTVPPGYALYPNSARYYNNRARGKIRSKRVYDLSNVRRSPPRFSSRAAPFDCPNMNRDASGSLTHPWNYDTCSLGSTSALNLLSHSREARLVSGPIAHYPVVHPHENLAQYSLTRQASVRPRVFQSDKPLPEPPKPVRPKRPTRNRSEQSNALPVSA
jgi:hypothetical protein